MEVTEENREKQKTNKQTNNNKKKNPRKNNDKNKNKTKKKKRTNMKKLKQSKGPEWPLIFTRELDTGSKYFNHRVILTIVATGVVLPGDVAAVLKELNSVNTIKAVLVDNNSTNIGFKAGRVSAQKKKKKKKRKEKLGKKLYSIDCSLFQNEHIFRAVLMELQEALLILLVLMWNFVKMITSIYPR